VDFSSPVYSNVSEVLVSGPASPAVSSVDDLAGKEVFAASPPAITKPLGAQPALHHGEQASCGDQDARRSSKTRSDRDGERGLIPLIVVDKHKADFWSSLPKSR